MSIARRRILVGLAFAAGVAGLAGSATTGFSGDDWVFSSVAAVLLAVGGLLVLRVPRNTMSWLLLVLGWSISVMGLAEWLYLTEISEVVVGLILFSIFIPGLSVLVPLWFPTGRPPSPRWNWVGWLCGGSVLLLFGGMAMVAWVENGDTNVIEGCTSVGTCGTTLGLFALLGASVAAITSFVARWRRSSGVERQQLRWLVPSFLVLGLGILAEFGGLQDSWVAITFGTAGMLLVPISIGLAITRYRLYDIDRIISRTVSYALVAGILAFLFALGVVWLPSLLPGLDDSPVLVAITTLGVATLFNPLRRRVHSWVERRFNRSRYDVEHVIEVFAGSLRNHVDPDTVVNGWVEVVSEAVQPSAAIVWVRE